MKSKLLDPDSIAWSQVLIEWCANILAGWLGMLRQDSLFCRLPEQVLEWFNMLPVERFNSGPGGAAPLHLYGKMMRAHAVFPWTSVILHVIRRDGQRGAARHVRVMVDETVEYGFILRHPCRESNWKPDTSMGNENPLGTESRTNEGGNRSLGGWATGQLPYGNSAGAGPSHHEGPSGAPALAASHSPAGDAAGSDH